jgi:hypothetical protein
MNYLKIYKYKLSHEALSPPRCWPGTKMTPAEIEITGEKKYEKSNTIGWVLLFSDIIDMFKLPGIEFNMLVVWVFYCNNANGAWVV